MHMRGALATALLGFLRAHLYITLKPSHVHTYLEPHLTMVAGVGFAPTATAHEAVMFTTTPTRYVWQGRLELHQLSSVYFAYQRLLAACVISIAYTPIMLAARSPSRYRVNFTPCLSLVRQQITNLPALLLLTVTVYAVVVAA